MATNPSLFKLYRPRIPWPVDVLKGLKGKREKGQKRPKRTTTWPLWGRIHAPEGAGEAFGPSPVDSDLCRCLGGRRKRVISGSRAAHLWRPPIAPAAPEGPSERFNTRRWLTYPPAVHHQRASNRLGADRRRAPSPVRGARPAVRHGLGLACPFWCPPTRRE